MKKILLIALLCLPFIAGAQTKIKETEVPKSVLLALEKKYDSYKVRTWYKEPGQYVAEFVIDGQNGRGYFTHTGDWQYSSFPVRAEECPTQMNAYFADNYPGYRIKSIDYIEQLDGDVYYRMIIVKKGVGNADHEMIFDPRGRLQKSNAPDPDAVKRDFYLRNNPDDDDSDVESKANTKSKKSGKRPTPVEDTPQVAPIDTLHNMIEHFNKKYPATRLQAGPEWINRGRDQVVAYFINRQGVDGEMVYETMNGQCVMEGKSLDKDHYTAAIVKYLNEKFKGEKYKIEKMVVYTYDSKWRPDGKKPKPYTYVVVSQKVKGLGNKLKFTRMEFDASNNFTNLLSQPLDANDAQ